MNYLDKICEYKQQELEAMQRRVPLNDVRAQAGDQEPARDFLSAVTTSADCHIIAEAKKASPSRGVIVEDFDPVRIANLYYENGAAALSVLTDEHFFQGKISYLRDVKRSVSLPVLRKDFTLHEYHIYEARAAAADAVLLIASVLEPAQLADYRQLVGELGMTALVEVHDADDLAKSSPQSPKDALIGINNRDLTTFETDLAVSEKLKQSIPAECPVVSESGIHEPADIERLKQVGIKIFLIGESLLTAPDPGSKLRSLLGR